MKTNIPSHESEPIRLGFIPQVDCAPLVVAQEKGIFARYGLNVRLSRELGWASIRDKISFGELDASQSTAGISIGLGLGLNMLRSEIAVPMVFNLQGCAITMSKEIDIEKIGRGEKLGEFLSYKWKKDRPMILAASHRFSSEHSLLTTWLGRHGVKNHRNLEIISLPGFLLPRMLKGGHIDGYCSSEPWNSESIFAGLGWCPATSADLASHHPGSVLMVSAEFWNSNKEAMVRLVASLIESCSLCESPEFREELISLLARKECGSSSPKILRNSLGPIFDSGVGSTQGENFHIFHGSDTNRPNIHKASWVLSSLRNDDTIPNGTCGSLSTVFREDICIAAESLIYERRMEINDSPYRTGDTSSIHKQLQPQ